MVARHECQDLGSLVTRLGRDPFPAIHSGLTPDFRNGEFVFPFLEIEDSRHRLAFKMVTLFGLEKKSRSQNELKHA